MKAEKELKCSNLLVITWEYEGEEVVDSRKIRSMPLWKWLLDFQPVRIILGRSQC